MSKARELADSYTDNEVEGYTNGLALGVGQTWQDVTASRDVDVTYTNTIGRPILVSAAGVSSKDCDGNEIYITVDGIDVVYITPKCVAWVSAIVPSGSTYKLHVHVPGNSEITKVVELR